MERRTRLELMLTTRVALPTIKLCPPMLSPLDCKTPDRPPLLPWYRRVPIFVLLAPPFLCTPLCSKLPPGTKLPLEETLPGAIGSPIALTLALISFNASSTAHKVGLIAVIVLGLFGIVVTLASALM